MGDLKTTPLSVISGAGGSRVTPASTTLTDRRFTSLQVTTAGTITHCIGIRNEEEIDFLTDEDFGWSNVPLGLLTTGENCFITEITTGTAEVIAT